MARWKWALIILVLLPVVGLLALLFWWWLCQQSEEEAASIITVQKVAPAPVAEAPTRAARPAPATPDDLRRIEGIGPKISGVLQAAGITTFAELAASDVSRLRQVVKEAGIRVVQPDTWPEQAGLAAAGNWEKLKALQGQLKGGRRV